MNYHKIGEAPPIIHFNEKHLEYEGKNVLVIFDDSDYAWLKARDIVRILGYKDERAIIQKYVDSEDKMKRKYIRTEVTTLNHKEKNTYFINETGLYSLTLSSRLPSAKRFKRWVTNQVLPLIHHFGEYKLNSRIQSLERELRVLKKNSIQPTNTVMKHHEFVVMKKNHTSQSSSSSLEKFNYYALRVQKCNMDNRIKTIKERYPNARVLLRITDGNTINLYNRMKETMFSTIESRGNHFRFSDDIYNDLTLSRDILNLHLQETSKNI